LLVLDERGRERSTRQSHGELIAEPEDGVVPSVGELDELEVE
jgi:hypothetical protein